MRHTLHILQLLCIEAVEQPHKPGFLGYLHQLWHGTERQYRLMRDCIVEFQGVKYIAPEGMVVDGASIPRPLWALFGSPFTGPQRYSAVIHDAAYAGVLKRAYHYENARGPARISRRRADKIFRDMLRARHAIWLKALIMYLGVRVGGRGHWKK